MPNHDRSGARLDRRRFLTSLAALGASLAACGSAPAPPQPAPAAARPEPELFDEASLRYLGGFHIPPEVDSPRLTVFADEERTRRNRDLTNGLGLAVRRSGGEPRLLTTTLEGDVVELAVPLLAELPAGQPAEIARAWGDVTGERPLDPDPGGAARSGGALWGLFWDDRDQLLYWSYGEEYNAISGGDPSIGASRLDDAAGAAQPLGAWRLAARSSRMAMAGVLETPADFVDRTGVGRLAAGFGGYFSIVHNGPCSMGPALAAFSPPEGQTSLSALACAPLLGYPHTAAEEGIARCERDPDYVNENFDGQPAPWQPRGATGSWQWTDRIFQAAAWPATPKRHGLLYFPTLGNGGLRYRESSIEADRYSHWCMVYDPADLAAVAQGQRREWEIQPRRSWRMALPGVALPRPGWRDLPDVTVVGCAYDPADLRLYLAVRGGAADPGDPSRRMTAVLVYELS